MRRTVLLLLAALSVFSCSRSEPKIHFGTLRLVWYAGENGPQERYTFFIMPEDDDGIEDLADLYLYHDREGLYWHFSSADWMKFEHEEKTWIGSRGISMPQGESLPRGQFRAVLVDQGGERSERGFTFDAPAGARHPFPSLTVSEGRYRINSRYPRNNIIFYDAAGVFLGAKTAPAPEGSVASLAPFPNTAGLSLWAEDADHYSSALTETVPLRR